MRGLRVLFALFLLSAVALAADSPFSGTWKLNLVKSKLFAEDKTTSAVVHIVADDSKVSYAEETTDDKGVHKATFDAKYDGKDYPIKGDPNSDAISYQRVGSHELRTTLKKDGKVTAKGKVVVSEDGQTTTLDFTVYVDGKPQSGVAVYEKQHD